MSEAIRERLEILDELEGTAQVFKDAYWCTEIEHILAEIRLLRMKLEKDLERRKELGMSK